MDRQITQILSDLVAGYGRQVKIYKELLHLTQQEGAVIAAGDSLGLTELLYLEDELIGHARKIDERQRCMKQALLALMPGNELGLERLACLAEPDVYIKFKENLLTIKKMLAGIEEQKNENIKVLREKLQHAQQEITPRETTEPYDSVG
ncbi:MAG: hypothetical protein SCK29_02745 [Bacillota bacterium]|nr:hypothetical protein [Bacillota bacterium]MDW7683020.1 hypothetical protein [Bacillota bacterium]